MTSRPIVFSAPMVRAILAGTKTQTRRAVKLPVEGADPDRAWVDPGGLIADAVFGPGPYLKVPYTCEGEELVERVYCPYGSPGDRLWVRETWGYRGTAHTISEPTMEVFIEYRADDARAGVERPAADRSGIPKQVCRCKGDGEWPSDGPSYEHQDELARFWKSWRSPRFMPKWASRITLEVTGVRVQRLQDISEEDARAEGIEANVDDGVTYYGPFGRGHFSPRVAFEWAWDTINGKRAPWASNPWVWAVEFKRVEALQVAA